MTDRLKLAALCSTLNETRAPSAMDSEYVWHYSIPAFDMSGTPVLSLPMTIGSNKLLITRPCLLFSRLNPRIPRVWDLSTIPSDYRSVASTEFVPFVVDEPSRLDSRYLYWFLRSSAFVGAARAGVRAATKSRERVDKASLFDIRLPTPSLLEQQRIAAVLDKADAVRRKRRESLRLSHEFLRSVFLEMFGDPAMNEKGWGVVRLGDCLRTKPAIGTITPASPSGEVKLVRVGELGAHDVALDRSMSVSLSATQVDRFDAVEGDLLLARAIGSEEHLGKASVMQRVAERVAFDSHVMRLRFDTSRVRGSFVWHLLQTAGGRRLFLKHGGRTAVQFNINASQVCEARLPLPPISEQDRFLNVVARVGKTHIQLKAAGEVTDRLVASLSHAAYDCIGGFVDGQHTLNPGDSK